MAKSKKNISTVNDDPWEGKTFIFPKCLKCQFDENVFCKAFEKDRRILVNNQIIDVCECPLFESKEDPASQDKLEEAKEKAKKILNTKPLMDEKTQKRIIALLAFFVKYKKPKAVYENEKEYICVPYLKDGQEEFVAFYDKETKVIKELKISEYNPKEDIEKSIQISGEGHSPEKEAEERRKKNIKW